MFYLADKGGEIAIVCVKTKYRSSPSNLTHSKHDPPKACHDDEQASEAVLQRMMALYVASHYRNTPNDLILMADAPAHQLYVLLGPVDETQVDVTCVTAL